VSDTKFQIRFMLKVYHIGFWKVLRKSEQHSTPDRKKRYKQNNVAKPWATELFYLYLYY